jgi:hypothetical protein
MTIRFVAKRDSSLMRFLGFLLTWVTPQFMDQFWTTLGSTIYYPTSVINPRHEKYATIVWHESIHVEQFYTYSWFLMVCAYTFFPLPILFSGRWWIERGAYLVTLLCEIKENPSCNIEARVDAIVEMLWSSYAWPWPKKWMKAWFLSQLKDKV